MTEEDQCTPRTLRIPLPSSSPSVSSVQGYSPPWISRSPCNASSSKHGWNVFFFFFFFVVVVVDGTLRGEGKEKERERKRSVTRERHRRGGNDGGKGERCRLHCAPVLLGTHGRCITSLTHASHRVICRPMHRDGPPSLSLPLSLGDDA